MQPFCSVPLALSKAQIKWKYHKWSIYPNVILRIQICLKFCVVLWSWWIFQTICWIGVWDSFITCVSPSLEVSAKLFDILTLTAVWSDKWPHFWTFDKLLSKHVLKCSVFVTNKKIWMRNKIHCFIRVVCKNPRNKV